MPINGGRARKRDAFFAAAIQCISEDDER